jgi:inosine/xanthosine triphosphatase
MIKVAIGSHNPAKIEAVQMAFQPYGYQITPVKAESAVSEQPFSDEETINGALNRAKNCLEILSSADIAIGLEGGVTKTPYGLMLCNWGALVTRDGQFFIAGGARIPLPKEVADRVLQGEELGPVMDYFTQKQNIRKKEGAIGVFTNDHITRAQMFEHIMKMLIGQWEYALNSLGS